MFQCSELPMDLIHPSISNCLLLPEPPGTGQSPAPAPLADVRVQTSKFCLLFLRVGDWKDAFLRGFNPSCVGRGCCVCLVWHRTCLIPFSVSVALSELFLWSVNLNVIAWPNHYKSGFGGIFSFKAGAVQGYLLYSFMGELIEVKFPLSSQNAPRGTGQCHTVIPEASLCTERVPGLARGTSGTSASGQGHSIAAAPSVSLHLGFYTVVFQTKNVSVLYLLARKCQVFSANEMKVLEIYFESEAKKMYWIIF